MSFPLLSTKFNIPTTGKKTVQRLRLLRILDQFLDHKAKLILVCGPAGYGKTTIVSQWLQYSREIHPDRCAWLTLEDGDNDLVRFLTYFVKSLQRVHPKLGVGMLNMLQTHKPPPPSVLATVLINELNDIPDQFFLIMDDYHLVTTDSIQHFMTFLVDHQPPQMGLVLISRTDPPLPLARLRARGQLVELRQKELCFISAEIVEFTNQVMGLELPPEQVSVLEKQTEGWVSGLQLAAISLQTIQNRSSFFKAFSGKQKFIADYLTDEVLNRLSEPIRSFLVRTSILDRLSAPLCEAVTGQPGAQAILIQLMDANLFINSLDNQQEWYRYHTLFADLLRKRLHDGTDEDIQRLHHRACRWYQENNQIDLAIKHALAGQDHKQAADMIEQVAERYLMYGEAQTLLTWLDGLPKEMILTRPVLGSMKGFALMLCGKSPQEVNVLLQDMATTCNLDEFQGETTTLRALLAILQGKSTEAIQLAELAMQRLPERRIFFRSLAADSLGMAHTLAGDFEAAVLAFTQVVDISAQSENIMMTLMALTNLAGLQYIQGHLQSAIRTCRQVLDMASLRIGKQTPVIGKTLLNLGEMLREQGDLDAALKCLLDAAGMMENFSEVGLPLTSLAIARIKLNMRDWPAAQSYIDKARQQAHATQSTKMDDRLVEIMQARYWIAQGQLEQVAKWAHARGFLDRTPSEIFSEAERNATVNELLQAEYLAIIRLTLAQQQPKQALEMILFLQDLDEKRKYQRRVVEILALKALALHQLGDIDQSLSTLGRALSLAESEGYQRTFVDEGEPMARLLYQAIVHEISPAYAGRLLQVISNEHQDVISSKKSPSDGLVEPLSERELDVLELIAEGLTNGEIAKRLYISLSTIKGHTTNIFGKLGVKNRTQAVAQARSLGLLKST